MQVLASTIAPAARSLSYVTGTHSMKVGATAVLGSIRRDLLVYGAQIFSALNGVPTQATYFRTPYRTVFHVRPNLGIYAQDQWTVSKLTLNAGLRFDYFRQTQPAQTVPPSGFVRETISVPFLLGVSWKDLNPRLGMSYDVFGNGKTALKATLNRYGLRLGVFEASAISPLYANNSNPRRWTDANNDRIVQGDPYNHAANGELGPSQNLAFGQAVATVHFDPEYQTLWRASDGLGSIRWRAAGTHVGCRPVRNADSPHLRQLPTF
jgi:hypothetical protein